MLVALCALASAAELQPGHILPGAVAMESGSGYAGTGFLFDSADEGGGALLTANVGYAPTERAATTIALTTGEDGTRGTVGIRYNVIQRRWLRAAPVLHMRSFERDGVVGSGGGAGLALDLGARRVRFDLGVPLLVIDAERGVSTPERMPGCGGAEMGLTIRLGDSHANRIRASATLDHVGFGYRYVAPHWFLDTSTYVGEHVGMQVAGGVVF